MSDPKLTRAEVLAMSPEVYRAFRDSFLAARHAEAIAIAARRERERLMARYAKKEPGHG